MVRAINHLSLTQLNIFWWEFLVFTFASVGWWVLFLAKDNCN